MLWPYKGPNLAFLVIFATAAVLRAGKLMQLHGLSAQVGMVLMALMVH